MRTGIIYKYTNKIHKGWSYIGQTMFNRKHREGSKCKNYNKCIIFKNAIQKYGIENFDYEILEDNIPESLLDEREQYWNAYFHTYVGDPFCKGYNMTLGGATRRGYCCSDETKQKISKANKWHFVSDKVKERMIELNKTRKGVKPKNFDAALEKARIATSKPIVEIETGKIFQSKAECAAFYKHTVSYVNARLKGHKKCKKEKFAEATLDE